MTIIAMTTDQSGSFTYFEVELTQELAKQMITAHKPLVELCQTVDKDFYCIECFDRPVDLRFGDQVDSEFELEVDFVYTAPRANMVKLDERFEAACLRYTKDGVMWTASAVDCNHYFETPEITWDDLAKVAAGEDPFMPLEEEDEQEE